MGEEMFLSPENHEKTLSVFFNQLSYSLIIEVKNGWVNYLEQKNLKCFFVLFFRLHFFQIS